MLSFVATKRKDNEVDRDRALYALKKACVKEVKKLEAKGVAEKEEVDLEVLRAEVDQVNQGQLTPSSSKRRNRTEALDLTSDKCREEVGGPHQRRRLFHEKEPESKHIVGGSVDVFDGPSSSGTANSLDKEANEQVNSPTHGLDDGNLTQSASTILSKSMIPVYEMLDRRDLAFNQGLAEAEKTRSERDALRREVDRLTSEVKRLTEVKDDEVNALKDEHEFLRKENETLTCRLSAQHADHCRQLRTARLNGAKSFRVSGVFKELVARKSVGFAKILLDKHISKTRVLGGYKDGFDPDRYRRVDKEFRQFVDISRYYDEDDEFVGLKFGSCKEDDDEKETTVGTA